MLLKSEKEKEPMRECLTNASQYRQPMMHVEHTCEREVMQFMSMNLLLTRD